jgi:hypothetical protein
LVTLRYDYSNTQSEIITPLGLQVTSFLTETAMMNNFWKRLILATTLALFIAACGNKEDQAKAEIWLPDTKVVKMPMDDYAGIPFNTTREEAKEKFNCTAYELSFSCKVKVDDKEEAIWLIYNEAGRLVLMKKELGYYNKQIADTIIERLTIKYGIDYSPSEGQESAFAAGIRKSKTYVFGGGQVAFQIGRSLNNRNELMLVYFFPEDVGTTFAKSVMN